MYQIEWFDKADYNKRYSAGEKITNFKSAVKQSDIEYLLLTHWEEHCLECAPPLCYQSCPLYLERADKKCRNFFYGIRENKDITGLFPYGAELTFRKWGKLETEVHMSYDTVDNILGWERKNEQKVRWIETAYVPLALVDKRRKLNGAYTVEKRNYLKEAGIHNTDLVFDEFVMECYSYQENPFRLIIECKSEGYYRTSVTISEGYNLIKIPFADFRFPNNIVSGKVTIYPEKDLEAHMVFTWLDFVKYKPGIKAQAPDKALQPAAKVKCVAWDLDNTLWKGVFIESKPEDLVINQDALALIKTLDEMGILQTIVSKNTAEDILPFLEKLGIAEYFLYPAINWGQKSENLKRTAKNLNINIDTFAVIDDSPFERAEIQSALPQVRVYPDSSINELLSLEEFKTPITDEGRQRRKFYMVEQQRTAISESFSGDYTGFLKSCDFHLNIFVPQSPEEIKRCYELVQRTNQLNISSRRFSETEFEAILNDASYLKYAFSCRDKFGEYGIVGFCIIKIGENNLKISDFVISCRVAQKMVEPTFISWLAEKMKQDGKEILLIDYIKTSKNSPILAVFDEMDFDKRQLGDNQFELFRKIEDLKPVEKVITVNEQ